MTHQEAKRVLILMSDTGGGHRASAEALKAAFASLYGARFQVDLVDLWMKHAPWPLSALPRSYRFLVDTTPDLYRWIWETAEKPKVIASILELTTRWADKAVAQVIADAKPDLIIAVHPLLQEAPLTALAHRKLSIPFVTVLTDLTTFHPTWFNRKVTRCFVPSEAAYAQALQAGLRPAQLRQVGLPIHPVFAREPRPKEELRRELGMRADLPAALLVGGGQGMGRVGEIAQAVAVRLAANSHHAGPQVDDTPAGQLVVICGRNEKLQAKLTALSWPIPTLVHGFVTNMADWMAASDCIITKAGPGTLAEAMARGLPILLSGYIPGQEEGNVPYVVEKGVGVYSQDPEEMAAMVSRWFGPERADLVHMGQRAREASQPQAVFQIVEEIAGMLAPADRTAMRGPMATPRAAGAAEGA
jgi:1,2-diacylglycerol 3-beta-galactosyltransferase